MKKLGAVILLSTMWTLPLWADFVSGDEAFENKRYSEAIQHFRPLADAGDFRSQYYMAYMYLNGYGTAKNDQLWLAYLRKSLDQDYHAAQALMGFLYSQGIGVPKDHKKAIEFLEG